VKNLFREQWFLAHRLGETRPLALPEPGDFRPWLPPRDRYWADPFPVRHEGRYYLFFEEYLWSTRRGRIVASVLRPDGHWEPPRVVLDHAEHLSYPCVFTWQGEWFLVPESGARRSVELWRCLEFPGRWTLDTVLMHDVRAADATLVEIDDRWWLFTCLGTEGPACEQCFLFHAASPRGPWTPHAQNPIVVGAHQARPAGRVFRSGGKWLRPAQDCSQRYGRRIVLHEIVALTPQAYREVAVGAIEPDWSPRLLGTHTWNQVDELTVVDGCRRRLRYGWPR
jgi:hypothetical protein